MNFSAEKNVEKQMFWARFGLMTLMTVVFYITGMFSILAFAPMAVGLLLFGQTLGSLLSLLAFGVIGGLSFLTEATGAYLWSFVVMMGIAQLSAYFIRRQLAPKKLFFYLSMGFALLVLAAGAVILHHYQGNYGQFIDELVTGSTSFLQFQSAEQAAQFREQLFEMPFMGVKQKYLFPASLVMFGAFQLWLGVVFILRFSEQWRKQVGYRSTIRELIQFKNPEWLIFPVLGLIALLLLGHYQKWEMANVGIISVLFIVSFFYFLQGFGVYSDFLRYLRLRGFMRIIFVFVAVVFMNKLLAIVGFFDLWINFRKFFKKQIES